MKKLLLLLTIGLSLSAFAATKGAPFTPEADARFNLLEVLPSNASPTANGIMNVRTARFTLDCSVLANCTVGAHSLGVALPANSLIVSSYFYVKTQLVSAGSGTIAISCEDANNIFSAANITARTAGEKFLGAASAATSGSTIVSNIAATCNITATIATGDYTAGLMNGWLSYQVTD